MNCLLTRFALWLVTLVVFPVPVNVLGRSFQVEVLERITLNAPAARECVEPPCVEVDLADRVLAYLAQAEKREVNIWLRDDIRIASITVSWSQRGVPDWSWHRDSSPYVAATYQVLRCHPDQVWPNIVAQRKAQLGSAYEEIWGVGSSPKKPVQGERRVKRRAKAREAAA